MLQPQVAAAAAAPCCDGSLLATSSGPSARASSPSSIRSEEDESRARAGNASAGGPEAAAQGGGGGRGVGQWAVLGSRRALKESLELQVLQGRGRRWATVCLLAGVKSGGGAPERASGVAPRGEALNGGPSGQRQDCDGSGRAQRTSARSAATGQCDGDARPCTCTHPSCGQVPSPASCPRTAHPGQPDLYMALDALGL